MAKYGYIGNNPDNTPVIIARQVYNPTGVQTNFTFNAGYTPGYLDVYLNGVKLLNVSDYSATDGSVVGITSAAQNGDSVEIVAYKVFTIGQSILGISSAGTSVRSTGVNVLNFVGAAVTDVGGNQLDISITSGITTADVRTSSLVVAGVSTFNGTTNLNSAIQIADDVVANFGASSDGRIFFENSENEFHVRVPGGSGKLTLGAGPSVQITNEDGNTNRAVFTNSGVVITGVATATSFSGNITGTAATFTGNVTIGGTLTYDDVTNIDSIGLITARDGLQVTGGIVTVTGQTNLANLSVSGISTLTDGIDASDLLKEEVNITAGKLSDNTNIDLENGMVHYFTTTETTTSTPNIRYSSSESLDSKMSVGQSVVVTLITTAAAGAYSANITIDGGAVTENWIGGSAPSDGGSSGVDIHTFTIIKTASATFTVIGNQSKTS